jgi:hypothetical protein
VAQTRRILIAKQMLHDTDLHPENGFKLIVPSPTMMVRRRLQAATRASWMLLSHRCAAKSIRAEVVISARHWAHRVSTSGTATPK